MIAQVKFTVRGDSYEELVKRADETLAAFMPAEMIKSWRTVMEVHDESSAWVGHVIARRKRPRHDDDDDFGW